MEAKDPIIEELKYTKLQVVMAQNTLDEYILLREQSKHKEQYDTLIESLEEQQEAYREKMQRILNGQF